MERSDSGSDTDATIRAEEMVLMTADYNGWADQPEEEREALDQLELTLATAASNRGHLPWLGGLVLGAAAREIIERSAA
jgi:hypothetical protein